MRRVSLASGSGHSRVREWEAHLKSLAIVSIVYAFLLSLLQDEGALLPVWLLDRWDHQTGKRAPQIRDRVLWLVPAPPPGTPNLCS